MPKVHKMYNINRLSIGYISCKDYIPFNKSMDT